MLIGSFTGILTAMFCRAHWNVAKRPVLFKLAGAALIFVGVYSFAPSHPTPVNARDQGATEQMEQTAQPAP